MACIFLQATYIMIPLFLELQAVNGLNNLPVLCLVYAVMQFPFCIFTLQGFMSAVPRDYEESARIDGAGPVKTFTAITLPYMLFVTTPQLITQFVGNINNFNVIYLLSNGNPTTEKYYQAGETDILVTCVRGVLNTGTNTRDIKASVLHLLQLHSPHAVQVIICINLNLLYLLDGNAANLLI